MKIQCLPVGWLKANCYVVSAEGHCAVIDPGGEPEVILEYIGANGLFLDAILLTHAHDDHTKGVHGLRDGTGAPVYMHRGDVGLTVRRTGRCFEEPKDLRHYAEGDEITAGTLTFRIIETPGHTPGGVCILVENALFTGDTLFRGSTGRADLGGNFDTELLSLKKLCLLPGDYDVYPGHGDTTTLAWERLENPYMKRAMEGDAQ